MSIETRKLIVIFAVCLLLVFNQVPVLASSPSPSFPLDSPVGDGRTWDNSWTETIFGNGTPPFTTVVYSSPQVAWNGTHWVKYEIKPINETAVILRTPTCFYLVGELNVSLLDPTGTSLHVSGMEWIVEQYSVTLNKWVPKLIETAGVSHNSTHVWQKWAFSDGSERVLYIGHDNKQTVTFTSNASATYRIAWLFSGVSATRIVYSNGAQANLNVHSEISLADLNFTQLALYDRNKFSLLIDYNDVDRAYYKKFVSGSSETGLAYVNLIYGNWTINPKESIKVDPYTKTFISEATLDGMLIKWGMSYPPTNISMSSSSLWIGQKYRPWMYDFHIYRGYVSFNTSEIRGYSIITSATLKLKTWLDYSDTDFTMKVMGGSQPIYNSSLETTDWNCGTTEVATWSSSQYPGNNIYINITIPTNQINKMGRTQFELKSDREGTEPFYNEYVMFQVSGSKLEVTWLPPATPIDGQWWYCWNSTTNEKAAIVLFGAQPFPDHMWINSLYHQYEYSDKKEEFILDLHANGFDVLSPKNSSHQYAELSYYSGTEDWVKDVAMCLKYNQSYKHVFIFGFSGGGVVAAYEIQKDYATLFSAAVIASAPVDAGNWSSHPIYNSADTASQAKVCTSFIANENDTISWMSTNTYDDMRTYYNNMVVHKEWHNWTQGENGPHDPFPDNCSSHPEETLFDATYNWYEHRHSLTVLAEDQNGTSLATGDVYIDGQLRGYTNSTFQVLGTREVFVNDFWEAGNTGYRYGFKNWTDGSVDPSRNVTVVENTTITARFKKKWCPGDVNGDGNVTVTDSVIVATAFGSQRNLSDPWPPGNDWNSVADLNCDKKITITDVVIVSLNFGNEYPDP